MASCLTRLDLDPKDGEETSGFKINLGARSEATGETQRIEVSGSIRDLKVAEDKLLFESDKLRLDIDHSM